MGLYEVLSGLGYDHSVVIHKDEFVNAEGDYNNGTFRLASIFLPGDIFFSGIYTSLSHLLKIFKLCLQFTKYECADHSETAQNAILILKSVVKIV